MLITQSPVITIFADLRYVINIIKRQFVIKRVICVGKYIVQLFFVVVLWQTNIREEHLYMNLSQINI